MTLIDFYLICFLVGFTLSLLSALGGILDLHLPGLHHVHGGQGGHIGPMGHAGHAGPIGDAGHAGHHGGSFPGSVLNVPTICAFLAWFGGIGFLLSKFSGIWSWLAFALAVIGGAAGSAIIFWFLFKVLLAHERPLDPFDYQMVGVLGSLTSAIRRSGTGEMTFTQAGIRRSAPARSDDGNPLAKNTDVLVTRYEKGIVYVRSWEDLAEAGGISEVEREIGKEIGKEKESI
jgi:hypothetical protein